LREEALAEKGERERESARQGISRFGDLPAITPCVLNPALTRRRRLRATGSLRYGGGGGRGEGRGEGKGTSARWLMLGTGTPNFGNCVCRVSRSLLRKRTDMKERERERERERIRDEQGNILMQRSPREIIRCRVLSRGLADFKIIRGREGSGRSGAVGEFQFILLNGSPPLTRCYFQRRHVNNFALTFVTNKAGFIIWDDKISISVRL